MNKFLLGHGRAVIAIALALTACAKKNSGDDSTDDVHPAVPAKTAIAVAAPFAETISAIGTVEVRPGHIAVLSAPAPTRVAQVLVGAGDHVTKGQALIELEQTAFQAAAASAEAAQMTAQQARDRAQRLVTQGIAARRDLEQAEADLARANADVIAARRAIELATIRSPIDGVVLRMSATLGASTDPTQSLIEVADPTMVDVVLLVSPSDASQIVIGNAVTLRGDQSGNPQTVAAGDIVDIAGMVDSASRTVAVRVRPTSMRRPLRLGETLSGDVAIATHQHAVTVPVEALVPEGDGFKVFVVDSANVAHARPVTIGGRTDSAVEIAHGLAAGERVVTYGAFGVDDGAKIVPSQP